MPPNHQTLIKIGAYDPPIMWASNTQITLNSSQWQRVIKDVMEHKKLEEFKRWLDGKLIKFVKGS